MEDFIRSPAALPPSWLWILQSLNQLVTLKKLLFLRRYISFFMVLGKEICLHRPNLHSVNPVNSSYSEVDYPVMTYLIATLSSFFSLLLVLVHLLFISNSSRTDKTQSVWLLISNKMKDLLKDVAFLVESFHDSQSRKVDILCGVLLLHDLASVYISSLVFFPCTCAVHFSHNNS